MARLWFPFRCQRAAQVAVFVAFCVLVAAIAVAGLALPSLADPPPYADVVGEDEPARYWRFDDPTGGSLTSVYEEVTAGNNGSNQGGVKGEPGALLNPGDDEDTSFSFSPNNSAIMSASGYDVVEGIDSAAFELWFRTGEDFEEEIPDGSSAILISAGAGTSSYGVTLSMLGTGQLQAGAWTYEEPTNPFFRTQQLATTAESWADGEWHHVVVNAGNGRLRIYTDGWSRASTGTRQKVFFGVSAFGVSVSGSTGCCSGPHFEGSIDEVAVYQAPLAEDRIQAHYTASGRSLPPEPIPDEQTFGAPCSAAQQAVNPTAECADPVNSATGSYTQSVTDLALAVPQGVGAGEPFAWRRTYNSQDETVGPLGRGWTFSYAVTLSEDAVSGDVTVRFGNGQQVLFPLQGDDSYVAGRGGLSSLEKVSSSPDTFDVTLHDQTVLRITDGLLTKITDTHLFETTLTYSSGKLATVVDPSSRTVDVTWTGDRITEIALPDGRDVVYGYEDGLLHTVQDARDNTTTYEYDGGLLTEVWDQRSHRITFNEYETDNLDANFGRVIHQTDALDNVTDLAWDPTTRTATMTDPRGHDDGEDPEDHQWTYTYAGNFLVAQADPYGNTYEYGYDADGNRSSITTPRDKTWAMAYDNGNLVERDWPSPLSFEETWEYTSDNQVESYTNTNNHTTTYEYNERRQLELIDQPDDPVTSNTRQTTFAYDPTIHVLDTITDPLDHVTDIDYDFTGLPATLEIDTTTEGGTTSTAIYDQSYRLVGTVDPRGNASGNTPTDYTTHIEYNDNDQVTSILDPLDHETVLDYDAAGNLAERTDPRTNTTLYGYDDSNRLMSVTPPDLEPTVYEYDSASNLEVVTDALDRETTYTYDNANRLDTVDGALGVTDYRADADGNIDQVTPPSSGAITYGYDAGGRLNAIDFGDATPDVGFEIDGVGHRTEMTDGAGTVVYDYDEIEQLTAVTRGTDEFSYGYDPVGNITARVYPDATETTYGYDDDYNLETATEDGNTITYGVDDARNVTSIDYPAGNDIAETRHYDEAGRLDGYTYTPIDGLASSPITIELDYTLDENGNPTSAVTGGVDHAWQYDTNNRLTRWCPGADDCDETTDDVIWTYDDVNNRLTQTTPAGTLTYNHDPDTDELSFTGVTTTYDDRGNLTRMGDTHFTWNLANQLTSVQVPTGGGSTTYTYAYDGDGNRLTSTVAGNTAASRQYTWDTQHPVPQLAQEADGTSTALRRYLYGEGRYSLQTSAGSFYTHQSVHGSEWLITDDDGHTKRVRSYDPFGANTLDVGFGSGVPENPHGFNGEYLDPTGSINMRARHYGPGVVSQFTSRDPLGPFVGMSWPSPYVFASQNPNTTTDPTGLFDFRQGVANFAGGVLDTISGGNGQRILDSDFLNDTLGVNSGGKVDWASGATAAGRVAGYAVAIGQPQTFVTATRVAATYNGIYTTSDCLQGNGDRLCGVDAGLAWANLLGPIGLGNAAGSLDDSLYVFGNLYGGIGVSFGQSGFNAYRCSTE